MSAPLPVDAVLGQVVDAVRIRGAAVVVAPPGSGKTTRVPPALLDAGLGDGGEIVVLEPRRIAARGAARHVARERGTQLGEEVGYQVRHDRRVSASTRIRFVTEGVLVRRLCADPFLDGVGVVVLDEFHERHVETDLAASMLAEIRATVRDDLGVVVMSATLDPGPIAAFLGGASIVRASGRVFPVEVVHQDRVDDAPLERRVAAAVVQAWEESGGDVLVFLPGMGEIQRAARALEGFAARAVCSVVPLHGSLDAETQDRAIRPCPGVRRIVLATNVAESSITIDGVTAVVDSGLARVLRHDSGRGLDSLRVERISVASADQRAGRAGRTGPGRCYRMWSRAEERGMAAATTPEIRRADLAGPALTVRAFAARAPQEFEWFDPPDRSALAVADDLLEALGALEPGTRRVTLTGHAMLREPLHPRLARVLVEADRRGCRAECAGVVALLSERELLRAQGGGAPRSAIDVEDRIARLAAVERARFGRAACDAHDVDRAAARAVARVRDRLAPGSAVDATTALSDAARRDVLAGFPDRVFRRTGPERDDGVMVGGRGVRWPRGALHDDGELFVALDVVDGDPGRERSRSAVRLAMAVERAWLDELPGLATVSDAEVDAARGRVVAVERTTFRGLVLAERRGGRAPDPEVARARLEPLLVADPWRWLGARNPARRLIERVRWLRSVAPDADLPPLDDTAVAAACVAMLAPGAGLGTLRDAPLGPVLTAGWSREQRARLASWAPDRVEVPSGRAAPVDYASSDEPFVAARVQELFGWRELPRLCGGRVPLVLHVLAPNSRPVQITCDLPSFWANVYPSVRSELSRRYPKHAWPEDPRTARAKPVRGNRRLDRRQRSSD